MIRGIRFSFAFIIFTLYVMLAIIVFIFRPFRANNHYIMSFPIRRLFLKILGLKLVFENEHLLTPRDPVIFLANHQNTVDIFIFGILGLKNTLVLGKREIALIPFYGWVFWLCGHILINRKHHESAMDTMAQVQAKIKKKKVNILIFPEGTRRYGKGLGPFKKGAFRLAINTQIPLLPIVVGPMDGRINFNHWHAGTVYLRVLPPFDVTNYQNTSEDTDRLMKNVHQLYQQNLDELRSLQK